MKKIIMLGTIVLASFFSSFAMQIAPLKKKMKQLVLEGNLKTANQFCGILLKDKNLSPDQQEDLHAIKGALVFIEENKDAPVLKNFFKKSISEILSEQEKN